MRTLRSRRSAWATYNATPGAHKRRTAAREAASIAGPCPDYPSTAPLYGEWLGGCVNGQTIIMRMMRGSEHRCDQWAAEIDGRVVAHAAGLTALVSLLRQLLPKAPSKRQFATMQSSCTPRDEADAAAADVDVHDSWVHPPLDAL